MIEHRHNKEVEFIKHKLQMTDDYSKLCQSGHDSDIVAHNALLASLDDIIPR